MNSKRIDFDLLSIALFAFIINAMVAYLLVFQLNIYMPDSMSRASSALSVLFGIDAKLTNIGFVWPPLVTLLQIPLVLFPPFRHNALSGNIITVFTGTGAAVMLALFLRRVKVSQAMRWLILATFILNPMIVFYSANGQSEMTFIFLVLVATYLYWRWREENHWTLLAGAGIAAGFAVLTRYDAVFFTATLAFVIGIESFLRKPDDAHFGESVVLLFAAPAAYLAMLWVAANWAIMGDPLFFARSSTSNAGRVGSWMATHPWLVLLKGDFVASLDMALRQAWSLFPAFVPISVLLLWLIVARRGWRWLAMVLVAWSLFIFSTLNLFAGQSFGHLRFFISVIPMSFVLASGVLELLKRWRNVIALAIAILFAGSGVSSAGAMLQAEEWGHRAFIQSMATGRPVQVWQPEQDMADYIRTQTVGRVLVDDLEGHRIMLFSGVIGRFVAPHETVFGYYLRSPVGNVNYVLATNPRLYGLVDQISRAYPSLYDSGGNWVKLDKEIGVWRLYRVIGPPAVVPSGNPADQLPPP